MSSSSVIKPKPPRRPPPRYDYPDAGDDERRAIATAMTNSIKPATWRVNKSRVDVTFPKKGVLSRVTTLMNIPLYHRNGYVSFLWPTADGDMSVSPTAHRTKGTFFLSLPDQSQVYRMNDVSIKQDEPGSHVFTQEVEGGRGEQMVRVRGSRIETKSKYVWQWDLQALGIRAELGPKHPYYVPPSVSATEMAQSLPQSQAELHRNPQSHSGTGSFVTNPNIALSSRSAEPAPSGTQERGFPHHEVTSAISRESSPTALLLQTIDDGYSDDEIGSETEHASSSRQVPSDGRSNTTPSFTPINQQRH